MVTALWAAIVILALAVLGFALHASNLIGTK